MAGERRGPERRFDLTLLVPLVPGARVGLAGASPGLRFDLEARGAEPVELDPRQPFPLPAADLDHLFVPDLAGADPQLVAAESARVLRPAGRVVIGLRAGFRGWRPVGRLERALLAAGFATTHPYGAYPSLPDALVLASLDGGAPTRLFLGAMLVPWSTKAMWARRAVPALVWLGLQARLYPSAVVVAGRAA